MSDAYGFIAPVYQFFSQLVFGMDIIRANQEFLDEFLDKKIVIIGGGDGFAYRKYSEKLKGDYWEKSSAMLGLAKKNLKNSSLKFHWCEFSGTQGKSDLVCLPFVLDTMKDQDILSFLDLVKTSLGNKGHVLVSDFHQPENFTQRILEKTMIYGFRTLTGHERKDVPNIPQLMDLKGLVLSKEKSWRQGWIRSQLYKIQ
jgi:hypothetical protein